MATHSRTISESSFEFVKTDDETQEPLVLKKEEKEENQKVLSFKDEISSEEDISDVESSEEEEEEESSEEDQSSDEEGNASEVVSIKEIVDEVIQNEETDGSEKSETVSLEKTDNTIGDSFGLTVEIPEENTVMASQKIEETAEKKTVSSKAVDEISTEVATVKTSEAEKKQDDQVESPVEKKEEEKKATIVHEIAQSDPLGALETPIFQQTAPMEQKPVKEEEKKSIKPSTESIILAEITQLRYEVDNITRAQKVDKEKIVQLRKTVERLQEKERAREEKANPPIQVAICGEWRLTNLKSHEDHLKNNHVAFQDRWRALMAHLVYDFDGNRLLSHNKLCCKTFNIVDLRLGLDMSPGGGVHAKTCIKGKTMVTVWSGSGGWTEKQERFIRDGQLHVVHTNCVGETTTKVYERVKRKADILYSIGSLSSVYLKFWK